MKKDFEVTRELKTVNGELTEDVVIIRKFLCESQMSIMVINTKDAKILVERILEVLPSSL